MTLGDIKIVDAQAPCQTHGRIDYNLRIKVAPDAQLTAIR